MKHPNKENNKTQEPAALLPIIRLEDGDDADTTTSTTTTTTTQQQQQQQQLAQKLRSTCIDIGFFYLEGHGIEESLMEQVMHQTKLLFQLSADSKKALMDNVLSRGYTAMGEETLDPVRQTQGDTKEGFYIGPEISKSDSRYDPAKLRGPNQWPSPTQTPDMKDCPAFRTVMEEYFAQMCAVGLRTVQLIALALGLDKHYFDDNFSQPMAALRLLHYDAVKSRPEEGVYAAGAHSDYGMLTLLLTDENKGLQVLTKQGEWVDVPPRKGAFIVNLGDMLERWTNGMFRSTKHRVLTAGDTERISIPFFYEPNFDTVVECLEVCCSPDNPPKYPPTTSGQHLLDKYKQTHADFQSTS